MQHYIKESLNTHLNTIKDIRHNKYHFIGIEKYLALFLSIIKLAFPTYWIRSLTPIIGYDRRNKYIEYYIIIKLLILAFFLYHPINPFATIFSIYILCDITQYLLSVIVLSDISDKLPSIKKNFSHLIMNIFEIAMGFAVLYLSLGLIKHNGETITSGLDALYFSFITFATIGYGDILSTLPLGKILIITETLLSFLFITIIMSSFVSGLKLKIEHHG